MMLAVMCNPAKVPDENSAVPDGDARDGLLDIPVEFDVDYARETRELTVTVLPGAVRLCTR
jgi:diacylglycerol kinase family enzyme